MRKQDGAFREFVPFIGVFSLLLIFKGVLRYRDDVFITLPETSASLLLSIVLCPCSPPPPPCGCSALGLSVFGPGWSGSFPPSLSGMLVSSSGPAWSLSSSSVCQDTRVCFSSCLAAVNPTPRKLGNSLNFFHIHTNFVERNISTLLGFVNP